jgi:hypothetical protein
MYINKLPQQENYAGFDNAKPQKYRITEEDARVFLKMSGMFYTFEKCVI